MSEPKERKPRSDSALDWLGISDAPNWAAARPLGRALGAFLVLSVPLLFLFALLAAGVVIYKTVADVFAGAPGAPNLGAGALIAALLGAPFVIWGTYIRHRALGFQKEGHITDRISQAVDQLGAEKTVKVRGKDGDGKEITIEESKPNIEVRIGGILSLERIAQDSTAYDKGRDHVRVMEILCAYVRENAPAHSLTPTEPPFTAVKPRIDVQTALTAIKRRSYLQKSIESNERYRLDLRDSNFDGCDFTGGDLSGAIFWRSRFEAARLDDANFRGARMQGSLLNFASFFETDLQGTFLDHCIINRPVPVSGGMARTINFAKTNGTSLMGADLTALDYLPEDSVTIGSEDTTLTWKLHEQRHEANGLFGSKQIAARKNDPNLIIEIEVKLKDNPFGEWIPYDSSDMTAGHFRQELLKRLGLIGWPYDN